MGTPTVTTFRAPPLSSVLAPVSLVLLCALVRICSQKRSLIELRMKRSSISHRRAVKVAYPQSQYPPVTGANSHNPKRVGAKRPRHVRPPRPRSGSYPAMVTFNSFTALSRVSECEETNLSTAEDDADAVILQHAACSLHMEQQTPLAADQIIDIIPDSTSPEDLLHLKRSPIESDRRLRRQLFCWSALEESNSDSTTTSRSSTSGVSGGRYCSSDDDDDDDDQYSARIHRSTATPSRSQSCNDIDHLISPYSDDDQRERKMLIERDPSGRMPTSATGMSWHADHHSASSNGDTQETDQRWIKVVAFQVSWAWLVAPNVFVC